MARKIGHRLRDLANPPAHCVVPGEGARAVRAGHPDALVPLPDVRAQVRLVAVGPLAERAPQFGARPRDGVAVVGVPDGHGEPHVVRGGQTCKA